MADSVAYMVLCYCNEEIYASWDIVEKKIKYWPEIKWDNCHDSITHCRGCGRNIKQVELQQYDEAIYYMP